MRPFDKLVSRRTRFLVGNVVLVAFMLFGGVLQADAVSIGITILVLCVANVIIVIGEREQRK